MDMTGTGSGVVGGGQGAQTQSGNTPGSGNQPNGGGSYAGNPNAPQVIDISEDSMVRLPGQKDPVKYGDYYRKFQSEFTKRAQAARDAEQRERQYQQQLEEYRRKETAWGQQQGQGQRPNPGQQLAEQIRSLPYLSGKDAAMVVENILSQVGQYDQALSQRDMVLGLLYKKLQSVEQGFKQIQSRHTMGDFETKIKKFAGNAGIPESAHDWVKELYLAYEGEDLDQEFPTILANRWQQLQNIWRESNRKRAEEARNQPFVPGRGGQGAPSRQLQNLAGKSPRELADALWPGMVDGAVET